jgi:hypothetical protein
VACPPLPSGYRVGRAILSVLFPLALACSSEPSPETSIDRDARAIRELTVPSAAKSLDVSSVEWLNSTARFSWELETTWSWEQYARWVTDRLEREGHWTPGPGDRESLDFIRQLPGDTHVVRIEAARPGPPLLIRVTFRAWAS